MANDGLIDTNVFVHAATSDEHSAECAAFLRLVERGELLIDLDPLVLHELSYTLPRYLKQMTKQDVADYLLMVLGWPGVRIDKILFIDVVNRWKRTAGLAFVDAYLAELATRQNRPVYTKNVREVRLQGAAAPAPLPTSSSS